MINLLFISFFVSFIVCLLIISIFARYNIGIDNFDGPQKFHDKPTPRLGGLGLFIGFLFSLIFRWFKIYDIRFIYFLFSILQLYYWMVY